MEFKQDETRSNVRKAKAVQRIEQIVKDYVEDPHEFVFIPDQNEALNHLINTRTLMMGVRGPPKTPYYNGIYILTIQFTKMLGRRLESFASAIKRIKFLDDYTPVAVNVPRSNGLIRLSADKFDHVQTLKELVDVIFVDIFYMCGLDMYDMNCVANEELFGLVHVNPNKFLASIFKNNLKFIINDDNDINNFCSNVIKQEQEQIQLKLESKSQSKAKSKQERYKSSTSGLSSNYNMTDEFKTHDIEDDSKSDDLNVECPFVYISNHDTNGKKNNGKDKFGKIGNNIAHLLKRLYNVPLEVTKNILFSYLDRNSFGNLNIHLVEIMDIIDNVEKRKQEELLLNTNKYKGKIFVTTRFRRHPKDFVVDIIASSVVNLKEMIENDEGIPCEQQRLLFVNTSGKLVQLEDFRCLSDYNVPIGATIYLIVR